MRKIRTIWALSAAMILSSACEEDIITYGDPCTSENCDPLICGDKCDRYDYLNIVDVDKDGVPDSVDNCVGIYNPYQMDSNGNGLGDDCDVSTEEPDLDTDGDGVPDLTDNCRLMPNPDQVDSDNDGIGDLCAPKFDTGDNPGTDPDPQPDPDPDPDPQPDPDPEPQPDPDPEPEPEPVVQADGSQAHPFVISSDHMVCGAFTYYHVGDTSKSSNKLIDNYPGNESTNEAGPEYYYILKLDQRSKVNISLDSEPNGVDVDIHLLSSLSPVKLVARADASISQVVDAGTYYVVADTFVKDGTPKPGRYGLNVNVTPETNAAGTKSDPIVIGCGDIQLPYNFVDQRSTVDAASNELDRYPGWENTPENGSEYIYKFTLKEKTRFHATLRKPEPTGTDIDLHLLSDLSPKLIARSDLRIWTTLEPGTYYLVADSYNNYRGKYILDVQFRPYSLQGDHMFNNYILKAVDYINTYWAKKGYGSSAYTHDLPYGGSNRVAKGPLAPQTMCVAAVAETILTAMMIYEQETGDSSVWNHLPKRSWESQSQSTIKGYLWVDSAFNANGSGDALTAFGMGMNVPFKELKPGSFINLNRSQSGHATVFIAFLDSDCNEYDTWNDKVVGFKYYSSQTGGFDYRYACWSTASLRCGSGKVTDTGVIHTETDVMLNTGVMYHPKYWLKTSLVQGVPTLGTSSYSGFNIGRYHGIITN